MKYFNVTKEEKAAINAEKRSFFKLVILKGHWKSIQKFKKEICKDTMEHFYYKYAIQFDSPSELVWEYETGQFAKEAYDTLKCTANRCNLTISNCC